MGRHVRQTARKLLNVVYMFVQRPGVIKKVERPLFVCPVPFLFALIRERKQTSPFCHRRVRLEAEFSDKHICVQISDERPGFDPKCIPDPTCGDNVTKVSGRGLFLIRSFMDQVAHNECGNQITMTKLRREDNGSD